MSHVSSHKKRGKDCERNVQDKNFHNETIISSISFLEREFKWLVVSRSFVFADVNNYKEYNLYF